MISKSILLPGSFLYVHNIIQILDETVNKDLNKPASFICECTKLGNPTICLCAADHVYYCGNKQPHLEHDKCSCGKKVAFYAARDYKIHGATDFEETGWTKAKKICYLAANHNVLIKCEYRDPRLVYHFISC